MIILHNNYYEIRDDSELMFQLTRALTLVSDHNGESTLTKLYTMTTDSSGAPVLKVPRGLGSLLDLHPDEDKTINTLPVLTVDKLPRIDNILPGITLRDDQVKAVILMLIHRRGILQMSTGSGKTETLVAFTQVLALEIGYTPNILIIVPTTRLVDDTIARFEKYGITATKYSKRRGHLEGIIVTHPMSVNNDISKNPQLLHELQILIADEGHHLQSDSWYRIFESAPNLEYCLAMSATVVDQDKLPIVQISQLEAEEALVVGATGNVLLNMPPSYYIERGILANPVMIRMSNRGNQYVRKSKDWHSIRKTVLESKDRISTSSDVVAFYSALGYKSLVLVDTKECAKKLVARLAETGNDTTCRVSFGGNQFLKWDSTAKDLVNINQSEEDTIELFRSGEAKILIGTSHILEGYDCPNLDVVVVYSVGKSTRRIVQGIGRVLRKTKSTKYAYIIDFTDHENGILARHSFQRLQVCRKVIGVPEHQIYHNLQFSEFKYLIMQLEELF